VLALKDWTANRNGRMTGILASAAAGGSARRRRSSLPPQQSREPRTDGASTAPDMQEMVEDKAGPARAYSWVSAT